MPPLRPLPGAILNAFMSSLTPLRKAQGVHFTEEVPQGLGKCRREPQIMWLVSDSGRIVSETDRLILEPTTSPQCQAEKSCGPTRAQAVKGTLPLGWNL